MGNPEGSAQRLIMQLKHNVDGHIQTDNPEYSCSTAA